MLGLHVPKDKTFKKSIETPHKRSKITAFQLFVRSPMQMKIVEFTDKKNKEAEEAKKYITENNLFVISHATYLINTATKDDKWEFKIESALNDLLHAEKMGAKGSVFHVGKHLKQTPQQATDIMFEHISSVINRLQEINSTSIYILETCASCGTELLANLKDFGEFYHRFTIQQKKNLKICIDTCHVFSAGYSLKTEQDAIKFIELVENYINWENVMVIHLNDSKKDVGCCVDRHANICQGCISKDDSSGLAYFVKFCYGKNIPMILETPHGENDMYEIYEAELDKIKSWL
jgi:deoxyribonuclease-4